MLFHAILALIILCAAFVLVWAIRTWALLPIRSGSCESIEITVCAHGEAPELEMQLRGLLWLQSNGIIPCLTGLLPLGSCKIWSSPSSSCASHTHPEPKSESPFASKAAWNASKLPHSF
jgi:hypothetical protein